MAAVEARFKEQAVLLGAGRSLVAIVTRPVGQAPTQQPAVVILNTGIVHRVGHHRMYVTLSRLLAAAGRTVVRFDFAGIGDSVAQGERATPVVSCLMDIKDVLDTIERTYQIPRFVLVGLCSGADYAVLYGHTDPRVVGLVLMDPTLPPTTRYYVHYILQRLGNPRNWLSFLTGRSGLLRLASAHVIHRMRPNADLEGLTLENLPFSPYLARCYRQSAMSGLRLLAIFTTVSTRHTYRRQWLDAFPEVSRSEGLRMEFFADSDHVFSAQKDRGRLYEVIAEWLASG